MILRFKTNKQTKIAWTVFCHNFEPCVTKDMWNIAFITDDYADNEDMFELLPSSDLTSEFFEDAFSSKYAMYHYFSIRFECLVETFNLKNDEIHAIARCLIEYGYRSGDVKFNWLRFVDFCKSLPFNNTESYIESFNSVNTEFIKKLEDESWYTREQFYEDFSKVKEVLSIALSIDSLNKVAPEKVDGYENVETIEPWYISNDEYKKYLKSFDDPIYWADQIEEYMSLMNPDYNEKLASLVCMKLPKKELEQELGIIKHNDNIYYEHVPKCIHCNKPYDFMDSICTRCGKPVR